MSEVLLVSKDPIFGHRGSMRKTERIEVSNADVSQINVPAFLEGRGPVIAFRRFGSVDGTPIFVEFECDCALCREAVQ